ncbi:antibiotic biosynthesis monooxygenase family protein [Shimwellia blattae]|uniref:Putative antibiotic biosynthesis monooxygenase n=1 Tax=Shimwellia blattae (strain ATCC 29907 / DSM 4481 / JCM 1650 / NBRC 105725 / CDC 9005-74) TaxID=630626 RepID=I2BD79_SHIBC|nr:antibiotic biosynthesis monooxygenase [Shimwellia blattae]AFJ48483.1 putative antibiotic biosynthesis monooxygenase [Shimwellia blattae DSM 4481 = NBRC 105725]GAB82558.1 putative antibiotic biosynthesis monooxygenase [Shimwellia blattae DSM 4481 = NBRC 105725]VDY65977.1 Antibiotic biosynthesis monooxygenase [Shimwellia blattae]VEC26504.1 Antibiotic biosynthesis monooxygenase [Shimwellia blattae]
MIAVLFEVNVKPAGQARYLALAAGLAPLLNKAPGFIAIERFQSLAHPGKILSLSWWEDEQAVQAWHQHPAHRAAQQEGRDSLFEHYRIVLANITREYSVPGGGK